MQVGYCTQVYRLLCIYQLALIGLYQFERIVQNMSQMNLLGQTLFRLPDIPNLNHTLMLIETFKYFPVTSVVSLDKNIQDRYQDFLDSEISLDLDLKQANQQTILSASTIKKKKGGCTCKKTKCLKMYCECFSSGKMCTPECNCYGCSNDCKHQEQIAKAKEAIKLKMMNASKQNHGKGCNCKKSQCQKKYCECFNAGISCGDECKCEDCANGSCNDHRNSNSYRTESNNEQEKGGFSPIFE